MPSPKSPSTPTKRQVKETFETVKNLCPGVRIKNVGPNGITFEYPNENKFGSEWENKPFSGEDAI